MVGYAKGKIAFGFCDRCGWRYKLAVLRSETVNGVAQSNKVCPECWDADHPQNFLWRLKTSDPAPLRDPRPDTSQQDGRILYGWNPVGGEETGKVSGSVGVVVVAANVPVQVFSIDFSEDFQ